MNIGKLVKIEDLRSIWKHEEYNFSKWLALPENLEILSDEIGISLINPRTETGVGSFSADIITEEETSSRIILIENQLEASNHDHLGKLFTYGAGLDAEVIIWIVKHAREEHEQAINWINVHTDEKINFFLIQIELWQIGESAVAPKFNIIAKPNDWAKSLKQPAGSSRVISDYNLLQQLFWEGLRQAGSESRIFGNRSARPKHWYDVSIGSSAAHLALTINKTDNTINCELYIPRDEDKRIFDKIYSNKDEIESLLGMDLKWMRLDDKLATRIKTSLSADISDQTKWPEYFDWLIATTAKFKEIFAKRI